MCRVSPNTHLTKFVFYYRRYYGARDYFQAWVYLSSDWRLTQAGIKLSKADRISIHMISR